MTWGRMDDKFHRSRKVRELRKTKAGREALGAWVFWWSWCLSDPELTGEVPNSELSSDDKRSAELLVGAELWERTADGYRFHDFHDYNPTKNQRTVKLESDRARMAAKRSGVARDIDGDVASDVDRKSSSTSPPRARAGLGREEAYTRESRYSGQTPEQLKTQAERTLFELQVVAGGAQ